MENDSYKMLGLILIIMFLIIFGFYFVDLTNPTAYSIKCAKFKESYITFEPYKIYDYEIKWGEVFLKVLDKININIPSDRPSYISFYLCSPCKYNVTFFSTLPTNFFIFDEYNKERYFDKKSAFPLMIERSSKNKTFSFELMEKGKYYFVFDRSAQGKNTNDPATGRLIIYELKGLNLTTQETKYREVRKFRTVTRCD